MTGGRHDTDGHAPAQQYTVRAVDRVCDILDTLQQDSDDTTLSAIADATNMPAPTAFRYLWTLEKRRYVDIDPATGAYTLGLALLAVQSWRLDVLGSRALPYMEALRDETQETINLGVLDRGRVAYLEIVESNRDVRFAARPGDRHPIHLSALGKVIAAQLPDDSVRTILARETMTQATDRTITDVDSYLKDLKTTRRRGYGLDNRENQPDGRCVAVLVLEEPPTAISVSAPRVRMPLDQVSAVVATLRKSAELIAADIRGEVPVTAAGAD